MNFLLLPLVGYIDPGSGMLVLQLVVAGGLSVIAYFRKSILSFLGLFKGKSDSTKSDGTSAYARAPMAELKPLAGHTAESKPND